MSWKPSANIKELKQRAKILQAIRQFFITRRLLEVETPVLSQAGVTDVHLFCFKTHFIGPQISASKPSDQGCPLYLQTSPEFHMKRLLSAGSGSIFQISKVFRNEESGRFHNPEFTLLEWYRVGFDHFSLMDEMDQLLQFILKSEPARRCTYQNAFLEVLAVDPLTASLEQLKTSGKKLNLGEVLSEEADRDTVLQLLFCIAIEPVIAQQRPCFIYNFPASQAALARISPADMRVAERFEVYFQGIELANGFHELSDGQEQLERFQADNRLRSQKGLAQMPIDGNFISSLASLPDCAGVALGVDRLVMLACDKKHIDDVISFTIKGA
ncbi:elongation factor P lysine(34) lysyltransferase [Psychromonas sp. MB-3u-54]|uniref:elongation factor P--(R)-beta-lysine ligase n=1 Tax=Psychromonas sp. MB-3u-54 TaxID=2058319 RepID=UPI000C347F7E|nr:elongation factor P--(R)-beta-lysine ligase [Psychromonas sp. MB-3u-54]PKH02271.1 elongation factor P lysine(34) lysyltransferase [Psychromonas sp. MB-3u-54]